MSYFRWLSTRLELFFFGWRLRVARISEGFDQLEKSEKRDGACNFSTRLKLIFSRLAVRKGSTRPELHQTSRVVGIGQWPSIFQVSSNFWVCNLLLINLFWRVRTTKIIEKKKTKTQNFRRCAFAQSVTRIRSFFFCLNKKHSKVENKIILCLCVF